MRKLHECEKPLENSGKEISSKAQVLVVFDEFFVTDITDAYDFSLAC